MTYQCSFRCLHCFNTSGEHPKEFVELTDEEWLNVIKDVMKINVGQLSIGGGEATIRRKLLLDIANKIMQAESEIEIAIVSNGYFIDKEFARDYLREILKVFKLGVEDLKKVMNE